MATERASAQGSNLYTMYEYKCCLCPENFQNDLEATNHLKSVHCIKDGDAIECMQFHRSGLFCKSIFKSFKALRKHMKEEKCKVYSSDVTQNVHDENSLAEWNCLVDEFGDLRFENNSSSEENARYSMAAHIENFVNKLIISHLPHNIVNDILNFSEQLVRKTTAMNKKLISSSTSINDTISVWVQRKNS